MPELIDIDPDVRRRLKGPACSSKGERLLRVGKLPRFGEPSDHSCLSLADRGGTEATPPSARPCPIVFLQAIWSVVDFGTEQPHQMERRPIVAGKRRGSPSISVGWIGKCSWTRDLTDEEERSAVTRIELTRA